MEKERFIDVLKNYSKSSEGEALSIISLKESFPYSQVLQALAARLSKDHQLPGQKDALQSAAIYAADRVVLKTIMSGGTVSAPYYDVLPNAPVAPVRDFDSAFPIPDPGLPEPPTYVQDYSRGTLTQNDFQKPALNGNHNSFNEGYQQFKFPHSNGAMDTGNSDYSTFVNHNDVPPTVEVTPVGITNVADLPILTPTPVPEPPIPTENIEVSEDSSVVRELMSDLERLNQLKHDFEVLYAATKSEQAARNGGTYEPASEPPTADKVERLIEMDNALNDVPSEPTVQDGPKPSLLRRRFGANEAYIDEIVNRKELEPETIKQKEQLEIIEQFIKTQPSITPNKEKLPDLDDDLNTIKTGEFSDNIVSETLVEILLKQGKKDRAIEVLKKLIWKFPQKKAYFAAQIDELKK